MSGSGFGSSEQTGPVVFFLQGPSGPFFIGRRRIELGASCDDVTDVLDGQLTKSGSVMADPEKTSWTGSSLNLAL